MGLIQLLERAACLKYYTGTACHQGHEQLASYLPRLPHLAVRLRQCLAKQGVSVDDLLVIVLSSPSIPAGNAGGFQLPALPRGVSGCSA